MAQHDLQSIADSKRCAVEDVLASIGSGDVIYAAGLYAEPGAILSRLHEIAPRVAGVKVWIGRAGGYPFLRDAAMRGHIEVYTCTSAPAFPGEGRLGLAELVPVDMQDCFSAAVAGRLPSVCMTASPPMDAEGYFHVPMTHVSEGQSVADAARRGIPLIVEENPHLHYTRGSPRVHVRDVAMIVRSNRPALVLPPAEPSEVETQIGRTVAALIRDGDTLQLGLGGISSAAGAFLTEKNDLGLHSDVFTAPMMELIKAGNLTGRRKSCDRGLHVFSFAEGPEALYPFLAEREDCLLRPASELVNPFAIARQDNMTAVNTLLEIDLTGQACTEPAGAGGAFCFAYGAGRAKGGKSILAFSSRTAAGRSRILGALSREAVVTVPRDYVDILVTEYGIARLRGRSMRERVRQLIDIAHPDDRVELLTRARELSYL